MVTFHSIPFMREHVSRFAHTVSSPRRLPFFGPLGDYLRTLSPGDKFIAGTLGALVALTSLLGAYALESKILVTIPSYGGSLTEGVLGSPRFINPLLALSDADKDLTALTHAGLMGIGEDGTLIPVLAQSYEVSEDGKTYTFILRDDIRFHDGSPVTSEDVVFTIEKAQDPGLKSPELANWANILVEALDARTVQFTLPKAYAPFLEDTTLGIIPAKLWRNISNEEFPFSTLMQEPVGAGPFTVSSLERGEDGMIERYTLEAFKKYALGRPYLDSLRFEFFSQEADLVRAYDRGRIESAHGIPEEGSIKIPYARVFGIFFNANQNPLFARNEVREALSLATDREGIVREVLGGFATSIEGPVPPGSGIDVSVPTRTPEERTAGAREILEDKGWNYDVETNRWSHEDAGALAVTLKTSNVPELRAVAQATKEDWEAFGVPVALEFYEPGDLTSAVIRPRRYEALLFGMVVGRDHDLFAFWGSSERNDPGLNVAMYANRTVDELLDSVREESDQNIVLESLAKLNETIAKDFPAVFLYAPDFLYALPKNMQGVTISQIASPSDRFANIAHWHKETERVWPIFVPRETP